MADPSHPTQGIMPFIIEPSGAHTHSLILLHGLGSNGEKFGRELIETGICSDGKSLPSLLPGARFIFPTSKRRRSSAFKRAMLTQWFDVASLEDPSYRSQTQFQGLEESSRDIFHLINAERFKVSHKNVILGGISQGCAMGLLCLLALEFPLGGFIGMSGWLPFATQLEEIANDDDDEAHFSGDENPFANSDVESDSCDASVKVHEYARELLSLESTGRSEALHAFSTPVLLGHGEDDGKIVPSLGEQACRVLQSVGLEVEWESYEGQGHWYKVPDQIDDIAKFITKKLG
ncbi:acyl thioesterase [Fusarium heterosporum]|uniref:Acyl thioesterase n=1 Tax=Fusarium heterosporum TaxID=42747 RepID=A0A8H5WHC0_FUSHE|nr:acyl thioesterase [Fusarium heterosporum]